MPFGFGHSEAGFWGVFAETELAAALQTPTHHMAMLKIVGGLIRPGGWRFDNLPGASGRDGGPKVLLRAAGQLGGGRTRTDLPLRPNLQLGPGARR